MYIRFLALHFLLCLLIYRMGGGIMRRNTFLKIAVTMLTLLVIIPIKSSVHASATAIGLFYGGCGNFSVDMAITGTEDDGGGTDHSRIKVTDGAGAVLYQEDIQIPVGHTVGS